MKSKLITLVAIVILFVFGGCTPQEDGSVEAPAQEKEPVHVTKLDRQGLVDLMTDYYEALVSKDQSKVPIATNIKFVVGEILIEE